MSINTANYMGYTPQKLHSEAQSKGLSDQEYAKQLGLPDPPAPPSANGSLFGAQTNGVSSSQNTSGGFSIDEQSAASGDNFDIKVQDLVDEFGIDEEDAQALLGFELTGDPDADAQSLSAITGLDLNTTQDILRSIHGEPQEPQAPDSAQYAA